MYSRIVLQMMLGALSEVRSAYENTIHKDARHWK